MVGAVVVVFMHNIPYKWFQVFPVFLLPLSVYVVETDRKKEEGIDRIMISENLRKYATEKFERRRELLAPVMPVIEEKLKQCSEEEAVLMKFLYGTMPVRDAGEYGSQPKERKFHRVEESGYNWVFDIMEPH